MSVARSSRLGAAIILAAALVSCARERARLSVALAAPPTASRVIVHGNCFAGWMLGFDLRVSADAPGEVVLESLDVRVEDQATGAVLAEESLDSSPLAALGSGHSTVDVPVGMRVPGGVDAPAFTGAVAVAGELRARDADGMLGAPFRLVATPRVEGSLPGGSGPCAPPP